MGSPGDQRSVQALVEEHYSSLYRYAFRLSGKAADAEDLTQDAFCQAQAKLEQLREWNRARSWLFSILRNIYLHRLRDSKQENLVSLDGVAEVAERTPEPLPAIEPERLQAVLDSLPEDFRTPLILFYFEDFSYRDIAEQMDLALGTVMSRLARAKAYLRSRLLPASPAPAAATRENHRTDGMAAPHLMRRANHGL
jgi:RNA polymerase sigma-70 factor (ECF subfamily)